MLTVLSRQGGRRYRQCGAALAFVVSLNAVGTSSPSTPTSNRRRYPQFTRTPTTDWLRVGDSLGVPAGGSSGGGTGGFSRAQVVMADDMPICKQSTARNEMVFLVQSADHVTGAGGLTLAITASKDGAAFASISPTTTDRGNGWYNLALDTTHTNTLGDLAFHITAATADALDFKLTVELDRVGATITGVTGNVSGSVGSISGITFPTNFSVLSIDGNGRIKPLANINRNVAVPGFMFLMTDAATHAPKTGLGAGVSGTVSIDGSGFGSLTNAVTEVSGGWYKVSLTAAETNGTILAYRFTAAASDDTDISAITSG